MDLGDIYLVGASDAGNSISVNSEQRWHTCLVSQLLARAPCSFQTFGAVRGQLEPQTGCRAAGQIECGSSRATLSCCNPSTQLCVNNACVNN